MYGLQHQSIPFTTYLIEALHCDAGSRGSKSIREDNPILLNILASVQYFFRGEKKRVRLFCIQSLTKAMVVPGACSHVKGGNGITIKKTIKPCRFITLKGELVLSRKEKGELLKCYRPDMVKY